MTTRSPDCGPATRNCRRACTCAASARSPVLPVWYESEFCLENPKGGGDGLTNACVPPTRRVLRAPCKALIYTRYHPNASSDHPQPFGNTRQSGLQSACSLGKISRNIRKVPHRATTPPRANPSPKSLPEVPCEGSRICYTGRERTFETYSIQKEKNSMPCGGLVPCAAQVMFSQILRDVADGAGPWNAKWPQHQIVHPTKS